MTGVRQWVTANRLQVAVTVLLALLLGAATWSSAQGERRPGSRRRARTAAAPALRVESVRFVYQSELPLAIGLAQAQVRRERSGTSGPGPTRR